MDYQIKVYNNRFFVDIARYVGWGKKNELLLHEGTITLLVHTVSDIVTVDEFKIKKGVLKGIMDRRPPILSSSY